ncbi:hypothetical protein JCM5350_004749 [Sporobolomyces pararoseus]
MASGPLTTTTTTQQWILKKYSRSRNVPEPAPKRQKIGESKVIPTRPKEEFDHFVQPQLLLCLETTRSSSAFSSDLPITHSMFLNVYYDPHSSPSQRRSGEQILVLDSFDLVSFSSPTIRTLCPPDELPLKGVFKDEIVGMRYLSVDSTTGTAGFKRVQFKFESQEERERFMSVVQGIIPFKPAESTSKIPSTSTRMTAPRVGSNNYPGSNYGQRGSTPSNSTRSMPPPLSRLPRPTPSPRLGPLPPLPAATTLPPHPYQEPRPPFPPPPAVASSQNQLSARLSTLLPNLTLIARVEPDSGGISTDAREETASEQLAKMNSDEFEKLFEQVLFEDGFEELVERVQGMVQRELS